MYICARDTSTVAEFVECINSLLLTFATYSASPLVAYISSQAEIGPDRDHVHALQLTLSYLYGHQRCNIVRYWERNRGVGEIALAYAPRR